MVDVRGIGISIGLAVLCACGRIGFDGHGTSPPDGSGSGSDGPGSSEVACEDLPGILFCDGFESGSMLDFSEATPPSFVAVDAEQVYRGQAALHARTTRGGEPAWLVGTVLPGLTSGELYARWYHYYPSSAPSRTWASIHIISNTPPHRGVVFGTTNGAVEVLATQNMDFHTSTVIIPFDRWFCVQMRITIGTAGSVATWIDGIPAARLDNVVTRPTAGDIENVHAGMFNADPVGANDLWTDELAIGTEPIDC